MTKFAFALALVAAPSAFACPDLSGVYTHCTSATGVSQVSAATVTQETVRGFEEYTLTAPGEAPEVYTADGQPRVFNDPSNPGASVTMTTQCVNDSAVVVNTNVTFQGMPVMTGTMNVTKSGSVLTQEIQMTGNNQTIRDTVTCQ